MRLPRLGNFGFLPNVDLMDFPDLIPARYQCPFCGEFNEILVDPTGGERQVFVEDCTVCCRPATITARLDAGALASLDVEPEN